MTKQGGKAKAYQSRSRKSGVSHSSCSKKRAALKERIRLLDERVLHVQGHLATLEIAYKEVIARLIDLGAQ